MIPRDSRIHLHGRLEQPNPGRERPESLFCEGNLHRRQINTPKFLCAALGEVTKRVPASTTQFQHARAGHFVEQRQSISVGASGPYSGSAVPPWDIGATLFQPE